MKTQDQLELEFYKNGSAKRVLERYEFNSEEKKLIYDAIRAANSDKPRMLFVRKADKLLREVVKTRKPMSSKTDSIAESEALANFEKLMHKQSHRLDISKKHSTFLGLKRKSSFVLLFIIVVVLTISYIKT